jgi:hypothetical protein
MEAGCFTGLTRRTPLIGLGCGRMLGLALPTGTSCRPECCGVSGTLRKQQLSVQAAERLILPSTATAATNDCFFFIRISLCYRRRRFPPAFRLRHAFRRAAFTLPYLVRLPCSACSHLRARQLPFPRSVSYHLRAFRLRLPSRPDFSITRVT